MDSVDKEKIAKAIGEIAGAKRAAFPSYFPPMLASLSESPFSGTGWIYEPKMDGMRCIAFVDGDKVKLLSRRGQNITSQYPSLAASLSSLCGCRMVLDGEIIALNEQGRPSFQLLQKRMNLLKVADISRADERIPVHYFVFDTVHAGDYNLARCSLLDRKKILKECLKTSAQVAILNYFEDDGRLAFEACLEHGFEGIVAKRRESIYEIGRRSPYWVKVKGQKSSEFVIGGYSLGQGGRASTFGSLVLGYYDETNKLIYAGSVGSGFDEKMLAEMMRRMAPLVIPVCPFAQKPEDKKDATWIKPELVAEIKYMDFTDDLHLRNPVFLHLRHDIQPTEVRLIPALEPSEIVDGSNETLVQVKRIDPVSPRVKAAQAKTTGFDSISEAGGTPALPGDSGSAAFQAASTKPAEESRTIDSLNLEIQHWQAESKSVLAQLAGRDKNMKLTVEHATFALSNLDKILYPATPHGNAVTKREFLKLIAFLSPYILTHLHHRPLTMIRAPSGMRSRSFYQKHWNLDIPDFIETIRTEPDDPSRKDQLLCNNVAALMFLAQHNILEYHCWLSRVSDRGQTNASANYDADLASLDLPDFMAFDIDIHKEGEKESDALDTECFKKAREVAYKLNELLKQLKLASFLKTSGRNGLHVFIPIKKDHKFDEVRTLAGTIAVHAETQWLDLISTSAVQSRKVGKVFLDHQANTRGKSLAWAYTPRLTPTATVSTPIEWSELDRISPQDFNHESMYARIDDKGDIWKDILSHREDLAKKFSTRSTKR